MLNVDELKNSVDVVFFDCDATLSTIEGINYLAQKNSVEDEVAALTERVMSVEGMEPAIFKERLNIVQPQLSQLKQLSQDYYQQRSLHVEHVIAFLHRLRKSVYIISAGNNPAVSEFGVLLGVSEQRAYAVDLYFDDAGNYQSFDESSLLIQPAGKGQLINKIKEEQGYQHAVLIGDGMNDASAIDSVDRFIGYGANEYRENVKAIADVYVTEPSLLSILPLVLTEQERGCLSLEDRALHDKGVDLLKVSCP